MSFVTGFKQTYTRYCLILCLLLLGVSGNTAIAKDFYAGKIILMIVPVPAGSGADVTARMIARGLKERIPGKPTIILKNLPGAGGFSALNYLYEKAAPDGLTLYWGMWGALKALEGHKAARFKPEKFEVIGSGANHRGTIIRTQIDGQTVKSLADLKKVKRLLIGGRAARNTHDMVGNLALKVLGVNFTYIPGYRGMAKIAPAIYASEVHGGHGGAGGVSLFFTEKIRKGETKMLYYHPFFDTDGNQVKVAKEFNFPGNPPSLLDLYKQTYGKEPSGKYWETYVWLRSNIHNASPAALAPPKTPNNLLKILRDSLNKTMADDKFRELWIKQRGSFIHWNSTEVSVAALKNFRKTKPEYLKVLDELGKLGEI